MEIIENQRINPSRPIASKKNGNEDLIFIQRKSVKQKDRVPVTICVPWEQKRKEIAGEVENEAILRKVWQDSESLAHTFIWHCLVSF